MKPGVSAGVKRPRIIILSLVLVIVGLGAVNMLRPDSTQDSNQIQPSRNKVLSTGERQLNGLVPDGLNNLTAFVFSEDGPLGTSDEAARRRTRRLIRADRSNVDCGIMKCLALTFDDGPDSRLTPELIGILNERSAVATFFVLGLEVPGREAVLGRMVKSDCEIGNHTYSHRDLTELTDEEIAGEIKRANQLIKHSADVTPRLLRPPMGRYDQRVKKAVDMPLAMWSIDPRDWRSKKPEKIYKHVVKEARPGKVVVLHDIYESTVKVMPKTIDELQRRGYVLVTMSELFGLTGENYKQSTGKVLRYR